jgi:hypothetical protein
LGKEYRSLSSSLCNFLHPPVSSSLLGPNTLLDHYQRQLRTAYSDTYFRSVAQRYNSVVIEALSVETMPTVRNYCFPLIFFHGNSTVRTQLSSSRACYMPQPPYSNYNNNNNNNNNNILWQYRRWYTLLRTREFFKYFLKLPMGTLCCLMQVTDGYLAVRS